MRRTEGSGSIVRGAAAFLAVPLLAVALGGCDVFDDIVSVEAPSRVAAENLDDPANASLLVRSAVNDFDCALPHYAGAGGFIGTELKAGANLGGSAYVFYDARIFETGGYGSMYATGDCSGGTPNVYEPLSTARWQADNALQLLEEWTDAEVPDRTRLIATAAAYGGYAFTLLGEGMCSAAFDLGPEMFPQEMFEMAANRFTTAMEAAQSSGTDSILNMARVGLARVRLNMGDAAGAAEVARLVPEGFAQNAHFSGVATSTENRLYTMMNRELVASVEGPYRDMRYQGIPDPRVSVTDLGVVAPGSETEMWAAEKYSSIGADMPIATWEEAQLILAEAAVQAGNPQEAVDIINSLHARVGLPPFQSSDAGEVMDQIVYERRAELFLEGHHLMDLERYGLPLEPPAGEPFQFGGFYSDQTCFPLPEVEYLNNPNIPRGG